MNTLKVFSFGLLLCIPALAGEVMIPISDGSPIGSPLQNVGTVILSVRPSSGKTVLWCQDDWTIINTSSKPVMAFVETLQIKYPTGQIAQRVQSTMLSSIRD